ncbi:MAG: hypothetical protein PHO16_00345 [Candidatus Cloacimonetes bacterium]|jgi:hypothetical protein|nr:hypothetical protein [Candidatus Cloacimonadota bacterium]
MLKKILWICGIVLLSATIYTHGLPMLRTKQDPIVDPKINKAVLEYVNSQFSCKDLSVPSKAVSWVAEKIEILDLEELPGPHQKKRIKTILYGGYTMPGEFGNPGVSRSFKQKCTFQISKKYPDGIGVQVER